MFTVQIQHLLLITALLAGSASWGALLRFLMMLGDMAIMGEQGPGKVTARDYLMIGLICFGFPLCLTCFALAIW